MAKLRIVAKEANIAMTATLSDSDTARKVLAALPIDGKAQTWGDEIYFEISVRMPEDDAHSEVPSGTIAYWAPGHAFCIFFGQEPYSPVNVIGMLDGDAKVFARVRSGEHILVERIVEGTGREAKATAVRRARRETAE
jgi:uncharacterized protein